MTYRDFYNQPKRTSSLLKENPNDIVYKGNRIDYDSPQNICSFTVFKDKVTSDLNYFGYSSITNGFVSHDSELTNEVNSIIKDEKYIEKIKSKRYLPISDFGIANLSDKIKNFLRNRINGGDHSSFSRIIGRGGLNRIDYDEAVVNIRLFKVYDEDHGKNVFILTFWDDKPKIISYKRFYDEVLSKNHVNPLEVLYEVPNTYPEVVESYEEFYGLNIDPEKESSSEIENEVEIEITTKQKEYGDKLKKLHTHGAKLKGTDKGAYKRLENEVLLLKAELNLLVHAHKEGKTKLKDVELEKNILNVLHHHQPKSLNDLYAELEKHMGMSVAEVNYT